MTSISVHVALAAIAISLLSPAIAIQDEKNASAEQPVFIPALSSVETVARQLGGDGETTLNNAVVVNPSQPMYIGPSNRHSTMIFLTAVGAGALIGALIDGDGGAGKGVLIGAAVGAGYLIAVHF